MPRMPEVDHFLLPINRAVQAVTLVGIISGGPIVAADLYLESQANFSPVSAAGAILKGAPYAEAYLKELHSATFPLLTKSLLVSSADLADDIRKKGDNPFDAESVGTLPSPGYIASLVTKRNLDESEVKTIHKYLHNARLYRLVMNLDLPDKVKSLGVSNNLSGETANISGRDTNMTAEEKTIRQKLINNNLDGIISPEMLQARLPQIQDDLITIYKILIRKGAIGTNYEPLAQQVIFDMIDSEVGNRLEKDFTMVDDLAKADIRPFLVLENGVRLYQTTPLFEIQNISSGKEVFTDSYADIPLFLTDEGDEPVIIANGIPLSIGKDLRSIKDTQLLLDRLSQFHFIWRDQQGRLNAGHIDISKLAGTTVSEILDESLPQAYPDIGRMLPAKLDNGTTGTHAVRLLTEWSILPIVRQKQAETLVDEIFIAVVPPNVLSDEVLSEIASKVPAAKNQTNTVYLTDAGKWAILDSLRIGNLDSEYDPFSIRFPLK